MTLFEVQTAARVEVEGRPSKDLSPAQQRGLKYQAKVEKKLETLFPGRVLLRPWFRYKVEYKHNLCQPDVLLFDPEHAHIIIVEIKYSTTAEAWKQLSLYIPVVRKAYRLSISAALITRIFDPAVKFPIPVTQLEGLECLDSWRGSKDLGVVSWR